MHNISEQIKISMTKQKNLRTEVNEMIDNYCSNCPILLKNREELGNKQAYKSCIQSCITLKKIQNKNDELMREQTYLRTLIVKKKRYGKAM